MEIAELLLDKILEYVSTQKECAEKLKAQANKLEKVDNDTKIGKITGSAASVGGSALMIAAGIATLCTGGAALPYVATIGTVISGFGSATSVSSEIIAEIDSNCKMTEAKKAAEIILNLEDGIHKLMNSLQKEGEMKEKAAAACFGAPQENYVEQQVLKAIAKRKGLFINSNIILQIKPFLSKMETSRENGLHKTLGLYSFFGTLVTKKAVKTVAKKTQFATSAGAKAAAKAVGRVGGGVFGLVLSVPELIANVNEGSKVADATQNLREHAEVLLAASKELERDLKEIENAIEGLAKIRDSIETSSDERKTLMDFAIKNCQNETARQWLEQNSECGAFLQLVDMFQLIKKHLDKKDKENHINKIDITFIAHGFISDPLIPASCLLPLPTISDVLLYSPWNCYLTADAAYAVATGRMKPQHRVFDREDSGKDHQPENLPDEWNSMKKAAEKGRKVPNIFLSPFSQAGDPAWKHFEFLKNKYGPPDGNRIIIPFILPQSSGIKGIVPFSIVTLAMSLVLMFSRFQATLHLTACLGDLLAGEELDKCQGEKDVRQKYLSEQYAYANNESSMTCSPDALNSDLWKKLAAFLST